MAYQGLSIRADQEVVTTEHDHYSHHESIRLAALRSGAAMRYVSLYEKAADARADDIVARIARSIGPKTRAVGITWVASSTGVKLPISAIAEAITKANRGRAGADRCLLIVDGVHGFANQDVDVARLGCDLFASGTHKWLFAPRGTGFLWGRKDVWPQLRPTIPTFDPDAMGAWDAWMERSLHLRPAPPTFRRAGSSRTSTCWRFPRLSSSTAQSAATASRPASPSSTWRSARARQNCRASPSTPPRPGALCRHLLL